MKVNCYKWYYYSSFHIKFINEKKGYTADGRDVQIRTSQSNMENTDFEYENLYITNSANEFTYLCKLNCLV